MEKTIRLLATVALLAMTISGCAVSVAPGPGWHRCGWGWCR
jgi:hypothetical protein